MYLWTRDTITPKVHIDLQCPLLLFPDFSCANVTVMAADWEMFAAAIAGNTTQQLLISKLANYINQTPTNVAFSDLYNASTAE